MEVTLLRGGEPFPIVWDLSTALLTEQRNMGMSH